MLIYQSFDAMCAKQPEKACLIYGQRCMSYRQASRQIQLLAERLAMKIQPGDKVLLQLSDPIDQLLYFFAVVKAGGACVFVDGAAPPSVCAALMKRYELQHSIQDDFQPATAAASSLPQNSRQHIFLGALSSGSTGTPKLIWRDHQSWTSAFAAQSRIFGIDGTDTLYLAGNLGYTANLNACLHLVSEGGTVVMAGNQLPRTWVREIAEYKVSAVFMVPAHYRSLLRAMPGPIALVRSLVTAGAKIDGNTVRDLVSYFPAAAICEYYGASELGHVSYATAADLLAYPESVGRAFPGVSIRIEEGIIWVESPYLAPAHRPRGTVKDMGKVNAHGYLTLLGRQQGLINVGGVKVIPEQVESILRQCPGIAEAAVGPVPDPIRGERVCAWIVKQDDGLQMGDIRAFCRQRINRHCCPQKFVFVKELPILPNGKIDRVALKTEFVPAADRS